MIKIIPRGRNAKGLSEEALQIPEKRREAKGNRDRERYTQLNAEFQGITNRYKKAFLSEQYHKIEENNRMGKTRDLFKKIGDTKGTFHISQSESHSVMSDSLQPHGLQHAKLPCLSPAPRACSDSCPSSL